MNEYNADIKPYAGFRENNSPFYGNTLSPFYKKKLEGIGNKSYIYRDGTIYSIKNGSLWMKQYNGDEFKLIDLSGYHSLNKKTLYNSGNEVYPNILGFFDEYSSGSSMLCANGEGQLAIVDSEGTLRIVFDMPTNYEYKFGEQVNFCEHIDNGMYCFSIGNAILANKGSSLYIYWVDSELNRSVEYNFGCYRYNDRFTVCAKQYSTKTATVLNVISGQDGVSFNLATSINVNLPSGTTVSLQSASGTYDIYFTSRGNTTFLSNLARESDGANSKVYSYANISSIADTGLVMTVPKDDYILLSDLERDKYEYLSSVCDNNSSFQCIGYNNGGYVIVTPPEPYFAQYPITVWDYVPPQIINIPDGRGGFITQTIGGGYSLPRVVGYETITKWTAEKRQNVPGNYKINLMDSNNAYTYKGVPIDSVTKEYNGGLASNVGSNFRLLYSAGALQAISALSDENAIGTLICGFGQIDSSYPVLINSANNAVYYKDTVCWNEIKLGALNDIELTVADDRYLILNTNAYYNCFDMQNHDPHHYGTDYNDRAIIISDDDYTGTDISTFDKYIGHCLTYMYASSQGGNYEATGETFPSYTNSASKGSLSKTAKDIKTVIPYGHTPNQQDISVYWQQLSEGYPEYKYSMDPKYTGDTSTFINTKLSGTDYGKVQLLIIPSIFAKYINGFINQGIVVDNGLSYIQLYANTTKPIFAVSLEDELEGVTSAFITQGQFFVVIDGSIYRYDQSSGVVSPIVNIGSMELVGYTPYIALFWSSTNKSFYTFTGDNTLNLLVQADEINEIVSTSYNPNTMSIYIVTDDSVYIFGNEQLVRLNLAGFKKCYPLNFGMAITKDSESVYLTYNNVEGYNPEPIILETEFYGEGNSVKAVNDCVYIRLFDRGRKSGKVKIRCQTINEGSVESEVKEFNINPTMWDKGTDTIFIRYQPKFQACAGFCVHIESPFSIATLQISETPETVQNSKFNI